ncbi:unnamed protein product [Symbiodinium sp. CCMP2456]|nr:unnamed protein product [Symbiodinium sp. CCMP2456]
MLLRCLPLPGRGLGPLGDLPRSSVPTDGLGRRLGAIRQALESCAYLQLNESVSLPPVLAKGLVGGKSLELWPKLHRSSGRCLSFQSFVFIQGKGLASAREADHGKSSLSLLRSARSEKHRLQ